MVVGIMTLELTIHQSDSLKAKRAVLNRVKDRVHNTFNVSIAEVEANDAWNYACLGVAVVANDQAHANSVLSKIAAFVEDLRVCELTDYSTEFLHVN